MKKKIPIINCSTLTMGQEVATSMPTKQLYIHTYKYLYLYLYLYSFLYVYLRIVCRHMHAYECMYLSTIRIHVLYVHKNVSTYKSLSYVFSSLEGIPDERERGMPD